MIAVYIIVGAGVYLLPTVFAALAGTDLSRLLRIAGFNLLFGWTVVGWFFAMTMAWGRLRPAERDASFR